MPPLPQLAPESSPLLSNEAANEDHFFNDGACVEILSKEDEKKLKEKRQAMTWNAKNRTDGNSQEIYGKELVRIMEEMKRYGITEENYEQFLRDKGVLVD